MGVSCDRRLRPLRPDTQAPGSLASRTTACSPATAPSSTTSRGPECCTPASCAAPSPARRSTASTPAAALALPGVRAVFTAEDLNPEVKEAWHAVAGKDMPDTPRPPLAEGEVKFVGDPVALVIAESRYVAEDAVELVDVDYEPLPAVADFTKAANADVVRPRAVPRQRRVRPGRRAAGRGDDLRRGARRVRNIYQHMYVPVPMETRGIIVEWLVASRELTIWASTQTPHELRAFCARLLGLPAQGRPGHRARHRRRFRPEGRPDRARTCASCWPRARCPRR